MSSDSKSQHILQARRSAGMSTTEGIHSSKPNPVSPSFDGSAHLLPPTHVPSADTKVTLRGPKTSIPAAPINIGAWAWGDTATWGWSSDELFHLKAAWKLLVAGGINWIDTAQAYGSGESERIVGELVKGMNRDDVIIQTKWYVVPENLKNLLSPSHAPTKFLRKV